MIVTVIPARGGSKSIPLKNIQPLNGKPLIEYTIKYSLDCPLVKHTVVSTDSAQIADIARACGAEVPFLRPESLAGDDVQDFPVIEHALRNLEREYRLTIDYVVLLRPTSPLRPKGLIEKAIAILEQDPECDSVRAVTDASEHAFRQWTPEGKYMRPFMEKTHEPYNIPRQELPTSYFQSGDIEVVRRRTILQGSVTGHRVAPLVINRQEMVDIDNPEDLLHAERMISDARK